MNFLPLSHLTAKSQIGIDEPASFRLLEPKSLEEAASMLADHGLDTVALAGGCDILEKIKTQWIRPKYVVNIKGIIPRDLSADSIGAGATLSDIARNQALPSVLRQAAVRVASPQIRNVGTIGGNLLQDSRCPYYRGPWNCYRAGGNTCDAVRGFTYEHALWGGERCFTVSPSDTAPALVAIGAQIEINGHINPPVELLSRHIDSGLESWVWKPQERTIEIEELFALPSYDITSMHTLKPGEILTRIFLPKPAPGTRSAFRKAAMRQSWDFALASVAVVCEMDGETCRKARIVLGAVAPVPWRAHAAEAALKGVILKDHIEDAVQAAVEGAQPLPHNHYKIGLVKNLVRECLEEIAQAK